MRTAVGGGKRRERGQGATIPINSSFLTFPGFCCDCVCDCACCFVVCGCDFWVDCVCDVGCGGCGDRGCCELAVEVVVLFVVLVVVFVFVVEDDELG